MSNISSATEKTNNQKKNNYKKNTTKVDQHDYTVFKVTMRTSKVVRTCFQTFCICIYTINLCSKQINIYIAWKFLSDSDKMYNEDTCTKTIPSVQKPKTLQ